MADPFAKPSYAFTPRPDLTASTRRSGGGGFAASGGGSGDKDGPSSSDVAQLLRGRLQQFGVKGADAEAAQPAAAPSHLRQSKMAANASPAEQLRWRFSQGQKQLYGEEAFKGSPDAGSTLKTFLKVLFVLCLLIAGAFFIPPPASFLPDPDEVGTVQPEVIASIDEAPAATELAQETAEAIGAPEGMSVQVHEEEEAVPGPVVPGFEQGSTEAKFASETGVISTAVELESTPPVGVSSEDGDAGADVSPEEKALEEGEEESGEKTVDVGSPPVTLGDMQGEVALDQWSTKVEEVESEAVPIGVRRVADPEPAASDAAPAGKKGKKGKKGKEGAGPPKSKVAMLRSDQVHKAEAAILDMKKEALTPEAALKQIYPLLTAHAQTYGKGIVHSHSGEVPDQTKLYSELATKRKAKTVCETGFNAGHSAVNWLLHSAAGATYIGFDAGNSTVTADKYPEKNANMVNKLANYLNGEPSSGATKYMKLHWGDVSKTVPELNAKEPKLKCDLIHVDGSRMGADPLGDLKSLFKLANESTLLIVDGAGSGTAATPGATPAATMSTATVVQVWAQAQKEGWVKEAKCHQFEGGRGFCYGRFKKTGRTKRMPWDDPAPTVTSKKDKKDDKKDKKKDKDSKELKDEKKKG